ncbi:acVLRF1 family peptidyl-tRNA hydrolase, partial [Arthrobacter sp. H41]|uniref:acVLRF1 family peptidyl-tRNA hydrolase n=1 Tax=Arthrobacter sp. H41 TaxID=1312978 RepID=UPI0006761E95
MTDTLTVLVAADRLPGWLERFAVRNGGYTFSAEPGAAVLTGANQCRAVITPPLPLALEGGSPVETDVLEAIRTAAGSPRTVGVILIRRGGYSVGVSRSGMLLASKTGTRYVQSRTAAGGWSQQRFARRRANQATSLVLEAAERAAAMFGGHPVECIQRGGDRALATDVFEQASLRKYASLPQLPFATVPDPRLVILQRIALETTAVRIAITGP